MRPKYSHGASTLGTLLEVDTESPDESAEASISTGHPLGVLRCANLNAGEERLFNILITLPRKGQLQVSATWRPEGSRVRHLSILPAVLSFSTGCEIHTCF